MKYKNHIPNNFSLASRTALITGGAGFLGEAESLLANDCSVIISDVSVEALSKVKSQLQELYPDGRIHTIVLDVTYQDSIVEASQRLDAESFNVDTLINNTTINPKVSSDGVLSNPNRLEN